MAWELILPSALIVTFIGVIPVGLWGINKLMYPKQVSWCFPFRFRSFESHVSVSPDL